MIKGLLSLAILLLAGVAVFGQRGPTLQTHNNAAVIKAMTLKEKARLVVGMGMNFPGLNTGGPTVGQTDNEVAGAAGTTAAFPDLGIPTMVVADGPAGLRISPERPDQEGTFYATAYPIASLLASTWDTELVNQVGKSMGNEVKEYGVDVILGPGMNIHRNPLGGRNFEYYSEDPFLTGTMATAMVGGIQSNGVGTSIKHFVANNHEFNRNQMNVKVSQRALREIYLRGFEMVIRDANPWTVMSSYNRLNGTYTSESYELLTQVLHEDWGYEGMVMTDWFGGMDPIAQMKAGNDLLMPGTGQQLEAIIEAVNNGTLNESILDQNVDRILTTLRKTPAFARYENSDKPDLAAHSVFARQAATDGMVLLKNDGGTLPVSGGTVALFGNRSYELISGGTGSGDVNEAYTVALPEGLVNAGYLLNESIKTTYDTYLAAEKAKQPPREGVAMFMPPPPIAEMPVTKQAATQAAAQNDFAIITLGRIAGEFSDRKAKDDFYLSEVEQQMLSEVADAFHARGKKVVVVINVGGVIETASWRDKVDAILHAWLPGQEAGNAIGDVLSGRVNPSGKLPTTFPVKYEDEPTAAGFPGKEIGPEVDQGFFKIKVSEITYDEGIFVGYRAFDKMEIQPAYEFGYGLSYTTFEYSNLQQSGSRFEGGITFEVTVTNTGGVAGREVAQLYLTAPQEGLEKPIKELKAFAKTGLLAPGESETLTFTLNERSLTSFDEDRSAWVAAKGGYVVHVGASSRNLPLMAEFHLSEELEVEKVHDVLGMEE